MFYDINHKNSLFLNREILSTSSKYDIYIYHFIQNLKFQLKSTENPSEYQALRLIVVKRITEQQVIQK